MMEIDMNLHFKSILVLQRFFRSCFAKCASLPCFVVDDIIIYYFSINEWQIKEKRMNDRSNKIRELIVKAIINNEVPPKYYEVSPRWYQLKKEIDNFIQNLVPDTHIEKRECILRAGRNYHYDFSVFINQTQEFKVEFKFNASQIEDTPQFVSPMKPSQYLAKSYEEYYYDNFIGNLYLLLQKPKPDRNTYLKTIHSPKPECVKELQEAYYRGARGSSKFSGCQNDLEFHLKAKSFSKESIRSFIEITNLNCEKLSQYLKDTQEGKCYMLYQNGRIHREDVNLENYEIVSYRKNPRLSRYEAKSKNGKLIKILLRWKNGNGIAFPSFQIS